MGNFAENLNLGNRFRPPLSEDLSVTGFSFAEKSVGVFDLLKLFLEIIFCDLS